jgi:TIR domain
MPTFISHSHQDEAIYSAICLALDGAGIVRWDPSTMSRGESLANQLHKAIRDCNICLFLATRRSIESQWCLAELGAFWGSGKRVILLLADPDLTDSVLPPQFKGNLQARNAHELIKEIKSADDEQIVTSGILGKNQYDFFATSGDYGTWSDWIKLVHETSASFDIMGVVLGDWRKTKDFKNIIRQKADKGCKARILILHEDNFVLKHLIYGETSYSSVRASIEESRDYYENLANQHENIEFRQMLNGIPHFFLTRNDQQAVIIQYLSSQIWGAGPTWRCVEGSGLYRAATEEFLALWKAAHPSKLDVNS